MVYKYIYMNYNSMHIPGATQFDVITKTCLFKYTEFFPTKKWKFSDEKFW